MDRSLRLEELEVYKVAMEIGEIVWNIVISAKETLTGISKAKARNLVSDEEFILLNERLEIYFRLIFGYINSIGTKGN